MCIDGGTGKSGLTVAWHPREAGQTDLRGSHSVLVLGSNSLEKELFCLEEMCQALPTFVSFLNTADFVESSVLLKARITILKFLNCTGFYGTLKCVGGMDCCSEASSWHGVRSCHQAVNRVMYNSLSSNLSLVVGKGNSWDDRIRKALTESVRADPQQLL